MQSIPGPLADAFFNPAHVGDAIEPNFVGRAASFECGATLRISLRIDASQRITEAKFKAAGCTVLVASASLLIDRILGKTSGEAAAIGQDATALSAPLVADAERIVCSTIACEALLAAIAQYSNLARDEWEGDEALICTCFGVSERRIEAEIQTKHLTTIAEVTAACNAGAGCRSCYPLIEDILDDYERGE
ncbi:MAG: iron-sulfur cluster assembly scaffold protein [Pyrinomonadaceae bacterium]